MKNISTLLRHLLLLMKPVEILLLHSDQNTSNLLQIITHTTTTVSPESTTRILNYVENDLLRTNWAVDARRKTFCLILCGSQEDPDLVTQYFLSYLYQSVPEYYALTLLFLVPWTSNVKAEGPLTRSYAEVLHQFVLPEPSGMVTVAVYRTLEPASDKLLHDTSFTVEMVTRNLLTWQPLTSFMHTMTSDNLHYVGLWGTEPLRYIHEIRNNLPQVIELIAFFQRSDSKSIDGRLVESMGSVADTELARLAEQYFGICCAIYSLATEKVWFTGNMPRCGSFRVPIVQQLVPSYENQQWTGAVSRAFMLGERESHVIRWGERRFALIVPNWWHLQNAASTTAEGGGPFGGGLQFRSIIVLTVSALTFIVLVFVRVRCERMAERPLTFDWLLCDTWSRLLAVSVPERTPAERSANIGLLAVLATFWGMLNGIAMTGVLFELSLSCAWQPVFGELVDVLQHSWLPLCIHDWAILTGLLYALRLPGGTRLNRSRVKHIEWSAKIMTSQFGAYLIEDSLELNIGHMQQLQHTSNGSMMYRILRDPLLVLDEYLIVSPGFLRPRMQMLARINQEQGLWQRVAATAQLRGRLNQIQTDQMDVSSLHNLRVVTPNGLPLLCELYAILNGLAVCVCLAERRWGGVSWAPR